MDEVQKDGRDYTYSELERLMKELKERIGVVQEAITKLDEINLNIAWLFDIRKELGTILSSLNSRLK